MRAISGSFAGFTAALVFLYSSVHFCLLQNTVWSSEQAMMLAAHPHSLRLKHSAQQPAASAHSRIIGKCALVLNRRQQQLITESHSAQSQPLMRRGMDRTSLSTTAIGLTAAGVMASIASNVPVVPAAILGAAGLISLAAYLDARRKTELPKIQYPATSPADTQFHKTIIERCPALNQPYKPIPFLTNGHVETIFAAKCRKTTTVDYIRECLLMPDGGCVALDWEHKWEPDQALPEDAPVLILLPGLTGGSHDTYVLYAVKRAAAAGYRAVVFNSRGTSEGPVTTPQYYSASFTGDLRAVVAHVHQRFPRALMMAAGWSLGANILVRYLGEEGSATPLSAAVSMANPLDLTISNAKLKKGFSQIYDINLATSLSKIHSKHIKLWTGIGGKFQADRAVACKTIDEFDEWITIHSFGWPSVPDYYAGSSSAKSIPLVKIPLLCIQALDDPIAPKEAIPYQALAANPQTVLVTTPCGGHLGWCTSDTGATQEPWTDAAMVEWLVSVTEELKRRGPPPRKPVEAVATVLGVPAVEKARSASPARVVVNAMSGSTLDASVSTYSAVQAATPQAAQVSASSQDAYLQWKAKQAAEGGVAMPRAIGQLAAEAGPSSTAAADVLSPIRLPVVSSAPVTPVSAIIAEPTSPTGRPATPGSASSSSSDLGSDLIANSMERPSISNLVNNLMMVVRSPMKQQQHKGEVPPPAPA